MESTRRLVMKNDPILCYICQGHKMFRKISLQRGHIKNFILYLFYLQGQSLKYGLTLIQSVGQKKVGGHCCNPHFLPSFFLSSVGNFAKCKYIKEELQCLLWRKPFLSSTAKFVSVSMEKLYLTLDTCCFFLFYFIFGGTACLLLLIGWC